MFLEEIRTHAKVAEICSDTESVSLTEETMQIPLWIIFALSCLYATLFGQNIALFLKLGFVSNLASLLPY